MAQTKQVWVLHATKRAGHPRLNQPHIRCPFAIGNRALSKSVSNDYFRNDGCNKTTHKYP